LQKILLFFCILWVISLISSEAPVILTIEPDHAPVEGSITIEVGGLLFSDPVYCKFGDIVIQGKWASTVLISCQAPPAVKSYTITLEVSNDNITYTSAGKEFYYYAVFEVTPNSGKITGDTRVTVSGINFGTFSYCKFGDSAWIDAGFTNSSTITCKSPQGDPSHRHVPVEVSVGTKGGLTANGVDFYYIGDLPEPTPAPTKPEYKKRILTFATCGIFLVFGLLFLLGWFVTRPKFYTRVPTFEAEDLGIN